MKNKLIYPLLAATVLLTGAACRGDGQSGSGAGQNYETVQEGSAAGVTSTIHGPGEVVPPLTGTNADTTTAFTLNPNVGAQPGVVAGTPPAYPPQTAYPSGSVPTGTYVPPRSTPQPSGMSTRTPAGINRTPVPQQPPAQTPPERQQPPTETTEPVPPPPATDTTATQQQPPPTQTTTAPPPPPAQQPKKEQQEEPEEEGEGEQTDTDAPPPPPPPPPAR